MTEAEWLAATDPQPMLAFLRGRAGERKLRLFAAACCRRIWHLLPDARSRTAVEVAERYADGSAGGEQLWAASGEAARVGIGFGEQFSAANAAHFAALPGPVRADRCALYAARAAARPDEAVARAALLRCIFGNPFRPATPDPCRPIRGSDTAFRLARAVYADGAFERLPVLADALEEAGSTDADLLGHLRGPGPHARGCWAVDSVLGKS